MAFQVTRVPDQPDGAALFQLVGELDLATVDKVRAAAEETCSAGLHVVLDMSGVGFCDSTGLGMIVGLYRRAASAGGVLRLAAPQARIRNLLEVSGVDRVIPIYDTVADALAAGTVDRGVGPA